MDQEGQAEMPSGQQAEDLKDRPHQALWEKSAKGTNMMKESELDAALERGERLELADSKPGETKQSSPAGVTPTKQRHPGVQNLAVPSSPSERGGPGRQDSADNQDPGKRSNPSDIGSPLQLGSPADEGVAGTRDVV